MLAQLIQQKAPRLRGFLLQSSAWLRLGWRRLAGHDETAVAHADADASVRRESGALQPMPAQANVRHLPIAAVFAAEQRGIVRGADGDAPLGG